MTRKSDDVRRTRSGPFWTLYICAWMVLAAGALSYLILAATNPRIARRILPLQTAGGTSGSDLSRKQARLTSEIRSLHRAVTKLDAKVADVQSTVAENAREVAALSKKIDTGAPATTTAAAQPGTSPITLGSVRSVPTTTERPQPPARTTRRNSKLPPLPTRVVRRPVRRAPPRQTATSGSPSVPNIINRNDTAAGVTTGSLPPRQTTTPRQPQPSPPESARAPAPAAAAAPTPQPPKQQNAGVQFGAPTVRTPVAPAAVMLSRALSLNELQANWEQLVSSHPALLGGLQPRYSQDRSGAYILLAGPLDDHSHAGRLCQALRASGVGCGINSYTGNAL